VVFIIDLVGTSIGFGNRFLGSAMSAIVFALVFGTLVYFGYGYGGAALGLGIAVALIGGAIIGANGTCCGRGDQYCSGPSLAIRASSKFPFSASH
jgi:hypothetical protein